MDPATGTGAFFTCPEVLKACGKEPWKPLDLPEIGISFQRFHSRAYTMFVAAWRDGEANSHVYALTVERVREDYFAIAQNDGQEVFRLSSSSHYLAVLAGLAAMRAYLIRGHRRTWTKRHGAGVETEEVPNE
jgi:hypothetical protein